MEQFISTSTATSSEVFLMRRSTSVLASTVLKSIGGICRSKANINMEQKVCQQPHSSSSI